MIKHVISLIAEDYFVRKVNIHHLLFHNAFNELSSLYMVSGLKFFVSMKMQYAVEILSKFRIGFIAALATLSWDVALFYVERLVRERPDIAGYRDTDIIGIIISDLENEESNRTKSVLQW